MEVFEMVLASWLCHLRSRTYDDPKKRTQEIPMGVGFIDTRHPVRKGRGWIWSMLSVQLPWVSRARVHLLEEWV
jgi:hypothetical protein